MALRPPQLCLNLTLFEIYSKKPRLQEEKENLRDVLSKMTWKEKTVGYGKVLYKLIYFSM